MFDARKFFARRTADALRGRFRRDEIGEILLQLLQLGKKLVVFAVGNNLPAFDVIRVVVPADFGGEFGMAFLGVGVCHAESFNAKSPRSKVAKGRKSLSLRASAALR